MQRLRKLSPLAYTEFLDPLGIVFFGRWECFFIPWECVLIRVGNANIRGECFYPSGMSLSVGNVNSGFQFGTYGELEFCEGGGCGYGNGLLTYRRCLVLSCLVLFF